jgi:BlaI family transcriptional regulator, penicillinase repressor
MEEVWRRGEATVRDVMLALEGQGAKRRAYTTIMTTMSRLAGKGLLERRRDGQTDVYRAALDRDAYQEARAKAEVSALVEQFGDLALAHFAVHVDELDAKRRQKLRRLTGRD